ncbi:hypothetical protein XF30_21075 [Bradyrhizobium sp. SUTN9-2]|nr:hypothetical protein XF30_21075 [Bradyrhizobium sp. SUTN9-2]
MWRLLESGSSLGLAYSAGIGTSLNLEKVKEHETTNDLYAFLTTEPNVKVGGNHPNAMPVISVHCLPRHGGVSIANPFVLDGLLAGRGTRDVETVHADVRQWPAGSQRLAKRFAIPP